MTHGPSAMRLNKKLNNRSGFTLAETLLAVLILLLVSVIVANGIPVARNVYNRVIVGANAQVLLSTAATALRNELGTARDVTVDNGAVIYYKASLNTYAKLSVDAKEGIQLLDYVDPQTGDPIPMAGQSESRAPHALVSDAAANKNLIVTYNVGSVFVDSDVITIPGLQVTLKDGSGGAIASLDELCIRMLPVSVS